MYKNIFDNIRELKKIGNEFGGLKLKDIDFEVKSAPIYTSWEAPDYKKEFGGDGGNILNLLYLGSQNFMFEIKEEDEKNVASLIYFPELKRKLLIFNENFYIEEDRSEDYDEDGLHNLIHLQLFDDNNNFIHSIVLEEFEYCNSKFKSWRDILNQIDYDVEDNCIVEKY